MIAPRTIPLKEEKRKKYEAKQAFRLQKLRIHMFLRIYVCMFVVHLVVVFVDEMDVFSFDNIPAAP